MARAFILAGMNHLPRVHIGCPLLLGWGLAAILAGCADKAVEPGTADSDAGTRALRAKVDTIVVIYAENRAFDNLFGNFPGARGLNEVIDSAGRPLPGYLPQVDRNGSVLAVLPPTWGGVTAAGCGGK